MKFSQKKFNLVLYLSTLLLTGCVMVPYYSAHDELSQTEIYKKEIAIPLSNFLLDRGYTDHNSVEPRFYGITGLREGSVIIIRSFTKIIDNEFVDVCIFAKEGVFIITVYGGVAYMDEVSEMKKHIEKEYSKYIDKEMLTIFHTPYLYMN